MPTMTHRLNVAVLSGGFSSEDYLSRRSTELIIAHANPQRYRCTLLNWDGAGWVDESAPDQAKQIVTRHPNILAAFSIPERFDIVINTLHGELECDGQLQGMFELIRLPYTGNGKMASIKGMNKILSKKIMREAGFLTPDWYPFTRSEWPSRGVDIAAAANAFGFPLIVKAATGGSSNSTELVENQEDMQHAIARLLINYDELYLEPFLNGLEYTAAVFGRPGSARFLSLPVARIAYEGRMFDAAIKKADLYQVAIPCGLSDAAQLELQSIAKKLHTCFRFNAFSRVDFRFADGQPYLLEVNTHPGLGKNSIVPLMLNAAGIAWESVVDWLIENGLQRQA
jgi:D-alanine-D-alanine ligase